MTVYGHYRPQKIGGKFVINPTEFIKANWELICEIAGVSMLELDVIHDMETYMIAPSKFYGGLSLIKLARNYFKITLNIPDLENDCNCLSKQGGNCLAILWSGPATIIREYLVVSEVIPRDQLLDVETAVRCGIHPDLLPNSDKVDAISDPHRIDGYVVQASVAEYIGGLYAGDSLVENKLHSLIRAEKDDLYPGFF